MEKLWKYIENQFVTATRNSFKKALKLSNYHDAALLKAKNSDPVFVPLYDRYHPLHLKYVSSFSAWQSAGGGREGETLNVKQLLDAALLKLDDWDVDIQVVYKKTTPRYKAIFNNGRKPFNEGGLDSRINAFNTLSVNIGIDPALAAVKALIDTTYTALDNARDEQEGAKGDTVVSSGKVNTDRIAIMNMQYRNLGWVMDNMFDNLETIAAALFDQETLRTKQQKEFNGTLAPLENKAVCTRTLLADDGLHLKVDGDGAVAFYLGTQVNATDSTAVIIAANDDQKIVAAAFGITDYGTHRFLTAVNQSNLVSTHYLVELIG